MNRNPRNQDVRRGRSNLRVGRRAIVATVGVVSLVLTLLFGVWSIWSVRTLREALVTEAKHDALALLEALTLAAQYSGEIGALNEHLHMESHVIQARLIAARLPNTTPTRDDFLRLIDDVEGKGLTIWIGENVPISFPADLESLVNDDAELIRFDWASTGDDSFRFDLTDGEGEGIWSGIGLATHSGGLVLWERNDQRVPPSALGGIGHLIQQIGSASDINYIMLQSPDGIVFASRDLKPILKLAEDEFLVAALDSNHSAVREILFEGDLVLEAVKPFLSEDLPSGMFRVGIGLAGVESAQTRLGWQLGISALLFVMLSSMVVAVWLNRRSLTLLGEDYQRIETMNSRILDSMDQGVIAISETGEITVFNRAAERITARSANDLVGRLADRVLSDDEFHLADINRSGEVLRDRKHSLTASDGQRELVYTTTPMFRSDNVPDGAVTVFRDETEARSLAERVRRSERLSEMGHLAAGVAHEIRNPLNAIAIAAQRLQREIADPEERELAATIWSESQRLNGIIEDYLSLARPSQEPMVRVAWDELLRSVVDMITLEANKSGIAVAISVADNLNITVATGELKKALWNIFHNALSATPSGGQITVTAGGDGDNVWLTVDDTGSGVAETDLSKVFQPYFTTKSGGTGLGLAITHRIITDHGGSIDLESPVPGTQTGTRVTISLPGAGTEISG